MKPYTAKAFSTALGLGPERYGRYERGEIEPPLDVLTRLRRVTGASLCFLVCGESVGGDLIYGGEGLEREEELQLGDRLRMVREILEPSLDKVAGIMEVDVETWRSWEECAARPPIWKMQEFCHSFGDRHGLGLDFLYRSIWTGVKAKMIAGLLERNPGLLVTKSGVLVKPHEPHNRKPAGSISRPVMQRMNGRPYGVGG